LIENKKKDDLALAHRVDKELTAPRTPCHAKNRRRRKERTETKDQLKKTYVELEIGREYKAHHLIVEEAYGSFGSSPPLS
jgi:hypothetical protein